MTRDELKEFVWAEVQSCDSWDHTTDAIMALIDEYTLEEYEKGFRCGWVQGGLEEFLK